MNIAVCFLSTVLNHFNFEELQKQAKESKLHNVVIYQYIDNNSDYENNDNVIYFCYNYLKNKFNYQHSWFNASSNVKNNAGIQFLPLLDMYINHKNEYDIYLFYEDDLSYFGNKNLFDTIDFNYDVIFQNHRKCCSNSRWFWSYRDKNHKLDEKYIPYHELLNIYALKPNVIEGLMVFMQDNYYHHECLISTYVLNNDYTVEYISNYFKTLFNFRNYQYIENQTIKNKIELVHPIKNKEIYFNIKEKIQTINI